MARRKSVDYSPQVRLVLDNARMYHDAYYAVPTFGGPSLHFHRRALAAPAEPLTRSALEYVYATLASWGMHRMGGGAQMLPFEDFEESISALSPWMPRLSTATPASMTDEAWAAFEQVFCGIRVMASKTSLVGNSKVMAHLLPHLVPPIDREYTLVFLRGNKNINNDVRGEWALLRELLEGFFYPVARDPAFAATAASWVADQRRYAWDTSLLKVIDNLVIGAVKSRQKDAVAAGPPDRGI
jgi:hypothetical protein